MQGFIGMTPSGHQAYRESTVAGNAAAILLETRDNQQNGFLNAVAALDVRARRASSIRL